MDPAILLISAVYCVLASAFDLWQRRIPNLLNYAAAVFAASMAWLYNVGFISFAIHSVFAFAFAYLLYRLGAWAGGDTKFFTVACMLLFLDGPNLLVPAALFLASTIISVPLVLASGGLSLRKTIPISDVRVGDVPASSYYVIGGKLVEWEPFSPSRTLAMAIGGRLSSPLEPKGRRIASSMSARGLNLAEISALKEAGVTHLAIRRTVAFAPALSLAFIVFALGASQWVRAVKLP